MGKTSTSPAFAREIYGEKVKRGIFKPIERLLHTEREDRMQEGLGLGFEQFKNKAEKTGELMDDALCVHVCRVRATDFSRHLARGNHTLRDASDQRNFHLGRTEVLHLDGLPDEEGDFYAEGDRTIEFGLARHLSDNPAERLASAVDLLDWLRTLEPEDIELLALRLMGFTIEETAEAMHVSTSTAFKRLRELGTDLANRSGIQAGPKPRKPRSRGTGGPRDEAQALDS
jgi:hypothetical protein